MPADLADRCSGLAVVTDRRAIIWESKTIDLRHLAAGQCLPVAQ